MLFQKRWNQFIKREEKKLPSNKENETNNVDIQTNLQIVLEKISTDLDEKFKQLKQFNQETVNSTIKESEETSILFEESEETSHQTESEVKPAVAEMSNPYIDVIN